MQGDNERGLSRRRFFGVAAAGAAGAGAGKSVEQPLGRITVTLHGHPYADVGPHFWAALRTNLEALGVTVVAQSQTINGQPIPDGHSARLELAGSPEAVAELRVAVSASVSAGGLQGLLGHRWRVVRVEAGS